MRRRNLMNSRRLILWDCKKLNNFFRFIKATYEGSPALDVSFYGREKFNAGQIGDLKPISTQVVQMDLHNMPLKDEELKEVLAFPNLEILNLNYTNLTGASIVNLKALKAQKTSPRG